MKQKDIRLIMVIVFISGALSLVLSNVIISSPKNAQQQVEIVQPISSDFHQPDTHYFNKDAFDPTKLITIGKNDNPDPFNGTPTSH